MAQTSINVRPVKPGSELHNERKKKLDYVRSELSKNNEHWKSPDFRSIQEEQEHIKADYALFHKKKMHAKATPIREAVLVIKEDTSIDQIRKACEEMEKLNGIKVMQIHIHKDEGHYNEENEWKPNLHAHIVFCWYNFEEHTTCKLNKVAMMDMQTVFARCLEMERGESSDRKHLNAVQQKNKAEAEKLARLQQKVSELTRESKNLEQEKAEKENALEKLLTKNCIIFQERGKNTISRYDDLCDFGAINKRKQPGREFRDRLETEIEKKIPTEFNALREHENTLWLLLDNTIRAIARIGEIIAEKAMRVPNLWFNSKKRIARQTELEEKAEKADALQNKVTELEKTVKDQKEEIGELKKTIAGEDGLETKLANAKNQIWKEPMHICQELMQRIGADWFEKRNFKFTETEAWENAKRHINGGSTQTQTQSQTIKR